MNSKLSQIIEAIIFVAEQPVKPDFLLEVLIEGPQIQVEIDFEEGQQNGAETSSVAPEIDQAAIEHTLLELVRKYEDPAYSFELRKIDGGFQFYSKKEFFPFVRRATMVNSSRKLSRVAMETLSIIAYRQPITKAEIEFIRGVNCDYAVQKLLDKKLISIVGRSDAPGRPLLYATSAFFMQYFGISGIEDLPKLKEFEVLAEEHMEAFRIKQEQPESEEETEQTESNGQTKTSKQQESLLGTAEEEKGQKTGKAEKREGNSREEKPETAPEESGPDSPHASESE